MRLNLAQNLRGFSLLWLGREGRGGVRVVVVVVVCMSLILWAVFVVEADEGGRRHVNNTLIRLTKI